MKRLLVFAAAAGIAALPIASRSAPPGGFAVSRPAQPPPKSSADSSARHSGPDTFKVPFDVEVQPRPLPGTAFRTSQPTPSIFWYQPSWYGPCLSNNGFLGPFAPLATPASQSANAQPAGFTIGSLVDGQSKNTFSMAPSYAAGLTGPGGAASSAPSSLSLQSTVQSTPCGAANFITI
ncbi:MAG TPA: hypothetical protein VFF63_07575 [Candidatus Babeliales bacterium]|nr:hypothetical protein [Candidatus Babeliales bacterium]